MRRQGVLKWSSESCQDGAELAVQSSSIARARREMERKVARSWVLPAWSPAVGDLPRRREPAAWDISAKPLHSTQLITVKFSTV